MLPQVALLAALAVSSAALPLQSKPEVAGHINTTSSAATIKSERGAIGKTLAIAVIEAGVQTGITLIPNFIADELNGNMPGNDHDSEDNDEPENVVVRSVDNSELVKCKSSFMAVFNHYEIKGFDRAFGPSRLHKIARECGSVIGWKEHYTSDLYWEASFHLPVFTKQCIERKMNESAVSKDIKCKGTG